MLVVYYRFKVRRKEIKASIKNDALKIEHYLNKKKCDSRAQHQSVTEPILVSNTSDGKPTFRHNTVAVFLEQVNRKTMILL